MVSRTAKGIVTLGFILCAFILHTNTIIIQGHNPIQNFPDVNNTFHVEDKFMIVQIDTRNLTTDNFNYSKGLYADKCEASERFLFSSMQKSAIQFYYWAKDMGYEYR